MKINLFLVIFLLCSFKSFGLGISSLPNQNQIDDSTDYNFFSPNNDSINDYFTIPKIENEAIRNPKFSVFNRWGDLVFEETPFSNKWNGKGNQLNVKDEDLPEGVYIYRLEYEFQDKKTSILGKIILKR
jgi:gliding motility-associated-like protein